MTIFRVLRYKFVRSPVFTINSQLTNTINTGPTPASIQPAGFDNGILISYTPNGGLDGDVRLGYLDFDIDVRTIYKNPVLGGGSILGSMTDQNYLNQIKYMEPSYTFHGDPIVLSTSRIVNANQFRFDFVLKKINIFLHSG